MQMLKAPNTMGDMATRKGGAQRMDEQVSEVETARSNEVLALASVSDQVMWPQPIEFFAAPCPGRVLTAWIW